MKNLNIRKLGATLVGATMAGAAFMVPAMAATASLQDYPAPFVDNGNTNFLIVVGQNANPGDIVGAINVAVRLGAERGESVTCAGGSSIVGGVEKDLTLDETMASQFSTMKYNKLAGYQHGTLRWNSKDVNFNDELKINGITFVTSLDDKDLGSDIYLGTSASSYSEFKYSYVIDDPDFNTSKVNTSTSTKLNIKFLGKNLEITDVEDGQITFKLANEVVLGAGETTTVDSQTIKINSIGQDSVSVTVGGDTKIITKGDEYDYGTMKVKINDILYTDDVASRQVDMSVGTDIEKTVDDGDPMTAFGEPDDTQEANWVWGIENTSTSKLTISAKYNQKLLDHKDSLKKVGDYFYLPQNYSSVVISKLSTTDYDTISGDMDTYVSINKLENGDNVGSGTLDDLNGFLLTSGKSGTGFEVNVTGSGMVETDTVYLLDDGETAHRVIGAYKDSDNKIKVFYNGTAGTLNDAVTDQLKLYYQDADLQMTFVNNATSLALTIVEGVEGSIAWDVDLKNQMFGDTQATAEAAELTINSTSRGTVEEDYRTLYGIIVRDPKSNGDSDQLELAVPSEQIKATVVVQGPQSTTTVTNGTAIKKAVPIVDNIARLDTDSGMAALTQSKNLILVGGPCVNSLTAQALGLPAGTCGAASTVPANNAMIKIVNNAFAQGLTALVVAGWDAENTRAACSVLQQFSSYSATLTGTGVEVDGTTSPTLKPLAQ
jgi:hypothetical protein